MATSKSSKATHHLAAKAGQLMENASEEAGAAAHRSVKAVRGATHQLHDQASRASGSMVKYIQREPIKSVLIAAATGAALMALVNLLVRSRKRD